jgi:hypothetical protein
VEYLLARLCGRRAKLGAVDVDAVERGVGVMDCVVWRFGRPCTVWSASAHLPDPNYSAQKGAHIEMIRQTGKSGGVSLRECAWGSFGEGELETS